MSDRRHTPEAQSRVTVPTVRTQRESGARALDPSPSTTRSGYLGRNNMSLVTGETPLQASTARRNIDTSGRMHSWIPAGTARAAIMPAVVAYAASGVSTSSLQNVPPCLSHQLSAISELSSVITMLDEVAEIFTPLQQQCSSRRSSPGENVFYCPICFENIKNTGGQIVALPCGHMFCRQCLFTVFEKKMQCPLCQAIYNEFPNILEVFM